MYYCRYDACRDRVAVWSAFACPNTEALDALRVFSGDCAGVVEVGAGLGYWGRLLNAHGVNTLAYDLTPTARGILEGKDKGNRGGRRRVYNEYHGPFPPWGNDVHPGEAGVVAEQHPDRVLLLCYPPPHSDTPSSNNNNNNRKKRKRGGGVEGSVEVVGNGVGEGCMACGALGLLYSHHVLDST